MSKKYIRAVLIVSIIFTILFTVTSSFEYYNVNQKLVSEINKGFLEEGSFTEYKTPEWATYVRLTKDVTGLPIIILFSPLVGDEGSLVIGIFLEIFRVPIVFFSWLFFFFVIGHVLSIFRRKRNFSIDTQEPTQKFTLRGNRILLVICILGVVILTVGQIMYIRSSMSSEKAFGSSSNSTNPLTLSSVTPDNGKGGDLITLKGSGFAGKQIVVWLVDKQKGWYKGEHGFLWKGIPTDDSPISFPLELSLCPVAFDPCGHPLEVFSKGEYVIEVSPLGGQSVPLPFRVNESPIVSNKLPIDISNSKHGVGGVGGRVEGGTLTVDAVEDSSAWITIGINSTKPLNYIEFNTVFNSVNGFRLVAYIDQKEVGSVSDGVKGVQKLANKIEELQPGPHTVSFRIDSYNRGNRMLSSSVTVTDLLLGNID